MRKGIRDSEGGEKQWFLMCGKENSAHRWGPANICALLNSCAWD